MPLKLRLVLSVAYLAALLVPAVPVLSALLAPPQKLEPPQDVLGAMGAVLDATAAAGRARMVLVWTLAVLALACLATVWAWWLARRGGGQTMVPSVSGIRLWAPAILAGVGLFVGLAIGDALSEGP